MFDFATTARLAGQFWTVHYTITESVWSVMKMNYNPKCDS